MNDQHSGEEPDWRTEEEVRQDDVPDEEALRAVDVESAAGDPAEESI